MFNPNFTLIGKFTEYSSSTVQRILLFKVPMIVQDPISLVNRKSSIFNWIEW